MTEEEAKVETYDGYKSPQTPRTVNIFGVKYDVEEVLDSKRSARADGGGMEERFKLKLRGYGEADVVYNYEFGKWKASVPGKRKPPR